jgi:biotin carboxyl carrier protein
VRHSISAFRSTDDGGEGQAGGVTQDPHSHDDHDHDHFSHFGHDDATALELSQQALRNVGLAPDQIRPITLETFRKSIAVPAVVVEQPGRTQIQVATPMTGVITQVHALQGEAVEPGTLLFRIRLTHEDLVQAQTDFLRTLGELDVEEREIVRLTDVTSIGAVAGKILLEREYARDKLKAQLRAQREALRLHGLSPQQVEQIATGRRLLSQLQIVAPSVDDPQADGFKLSRATRQKAGVTHYASLESEGKRLASEPLILQQLDVHVGQSVMAGETLCVLADYSELFIEGLAFEQDISQLREASARSWPVDAIFGQSGATSRMLSGLEIAYLANRIDASSRTLRFYVRLPNEVTKDRRGDGNRFVEWRYLPGQRLQLRVPVEEWRDQIVVPVDAVAREGAEYFVFQHNRDHFDRVPVHVKYKDQTSAVIENDGSVFPGDFIAMRGAHQLHMALKNKSGGGVDPHAGHSH